MSALGRPHLFLIFSGVGGALFFGSPVAMRLQVFSHGGSACPMPLGDLLLADSYLCFCIVLVVVASTCKFSSSSVFFAALFILFFFSCVVSFCFRLLMSADHRMV